MFGKKQHSSLPSESAKPQGDGERKTAEGHAQVPAIIPKRPQDQAVMHSPNAGVPSSFMAAEIAHGDKREALSYVDRKLETPAYRDTKAKLLEELVTSIDFATLLKMNEETRRSKVREAIDAAMRDINIPLTSAQIELLHEQVGDEILGLGPLEPLLSDQDIADIMINTYDQVYVEKSGKIYLTDIAFLSEKHLMGIIQRIVSRVGRRIDESSPMVDARLADGSRFNAIIPPLALDGCLVSIRKFKKTKMSLKDYVEYDSLSQAMARLLEICGNIRLNMVISGGTGSGKTTLLNAISEHIDPGERIVTIEDAAELQLHQPHVLRLETRPASMEGTGEVTQRQLVKNALRMRPDRIILGEMRGEEVIDVLSAMNTGHDGSLVTIHANSPRDCLSRIENLVGMSGVPMSISSLRYQIASAIQIIVQLTRMRDGRRRITQIEEVVGLEGDTIVTQTLFSYKARGMNAEGLLEGEFTPSGIRPRVMARAEYFGRSKEMAECCGLPTG